MNTHPKNATKLQTDEQNQTIKPDPPAIIAQNFYLMGLYGDHWGNLSISSSLSARKQQPISEKNTASGRIEKRISNSSIETLLRIPSMAKDSVHKTEVAPKVTRAASSSETSEFFESYVDKHYRVARQVLNSRVTVQPEQTSKLEGFSMNTHPKNASTLKANEENQTIKPDPRAIIAQNSYFMGSIGSIRQFLQACPRTKDNTFQRKRQIVAELRRGFRIVLSRLFYVYHLWRKTVSTKPKLPQK